MTNALAQWFADNLGGTISPELIIFLVSMIPILELRGGLLVASLLHVEMWRAIPICIHSAADHQDLWRDEENKNFPGDGGMAGK